MKVEIPDELKCVFSHITYLTVQIHAFKTGDNTLGLPMNVVIPSLEKKLLEERVRLSMILEEAVNRSKDAKV